MPALQRSEEDDLSIRFNAESESSSVRSPGSRAAMFFARLPATERISSKRPHRLEQVHRGCRFAAIAATNDTQK